MAASRLVPVACGAVALAAAIVALVPSLRPVGWNLTALPRVAEHTEMGKAARERDPGFYLVPAGGYDGQFYWGIAVDPIAQGDVHQAFDTASYRYGHPLFGWLAFAASVGQARAVPAALLVLGVGSLVAAAVLAAVLGLARGGSGWEGLAVGVNPGLVYCSVHSLTEPLSAALLLGALFAYARGRLAAAAVCCGLLVLSKEQFVLVPLALAGWEVVRSRRARGRAPQR